MNVGDAASVDDLKEEGTGITCKANHNIVIAWPITKINNA